MSHCVHDIDMSDCVLCLEVAQARNYVAALDRIATLERELAEAVEVQEDLAGRLFDAVQERDAARVALGEVTRERDALRAGKWAGPWEPLEGTSDGAWARFSPTSVLIGLAFVPGKWSLGRSIAQQAPSLAEAKAAADSALAKKGWYLADAPKPETPGDDGR